MFHNIISETEKITKWIVAIGPSTDLTGQPDNVYPFAGGEDQWTVVVGEKQIAWAAEYGTACMIFITALQTQREHAQRCPSDTVPFDGIAPATDDDRVDDYAIEPVAL